MYWWRWLCNKVIRQFSASGSGFGRVFRFSLLVLILFACCCNARYNVDELRSTAYDVEIAEIPLGFEDFSLDESAWSSSVAENEPQTQKAIDAMDEGNSVIVASEFGQKFVCSLPQIPAPKPSNESKLNLTTNLIADVVAASFYVQNCIRRNTGWWTYELCYNKHVQQFHMEGSKIVSDVISLGYYRNNTDVNFSKRSNDERPYFEQIYDDGTKCDVTEKSRLARVWYTCDDSLSTSEAYIADVDEPSSCEYIVKVKTGSLCKLDAFLDDRKPRKPLSIMCRPFLEPKAAEIYRQKIRQEKRQKEEARKKSEILAAQVDSIQRQRYARKRLIHKTPEGIREAELAEKELKAIYDETMRSITRLNVDFTKMKVDLHFIYDDLHEMETRYATEADEDRANIFWYFQDSYWDRKFFPVTISYSRARNSFYSIISAFMKKIDEEYDEKKTSLTKFLNDIDDGSITETHLTLMIGSLRKAFHEGIFPDVVSDIDDPENSLLSKMWIDSEKQLELLQLFEYKVLKLLNRQIHFMPEDLLSHVARQILSIRTQIINAGNDPDTSRRFSFIAAEKLFLKFVQSYNRAVLRYDKNSWGHFLKRDSAKAFRLFEHPNMFVARVEDLKPENAHLFYTETFETIQSEQEKGVAAKRETSGEVKSEEVDENSEKEKAAEQRMFQRAKRKNLRQKIERYLRSQKTAKKIESDELYSDDLDGLRKQLLVFKNTLEEKIRETGLIQGAEVKVQLVSPIGDIIASGGGITGLDDERINAVLKAFFLEQDSVNDEENRYDRLARGYTYGADEHERERVRKNGDDDDDDFKSSILPILKRVLP